MTGDIPVVELATPLPGFPGLRRFALARVVDAIDLPCSAVAGEQFAVRVDRQAGDAAVQRGHPVAVRLQRVVGQAEPAVEVAPEKEEQEPEPVPA